MFSERFNSLLNERKTTAYRVAKETCISQGLVNQYKNGITTPSQNNALKIAEFFGCSVGYLFGETDIKEQPATNDDGLTEEQREIIELFDRADPEVQRAALEFLRAIERREHKPDNT